MECIVLVFHKNLLNRIIEDRKWKVIFFRHPLRIEIIGPIGWADWPLWPTVICRMMHIAQSAFLKTFLYFVITQAIWTFELSGLLQIFSSAFCDRWQNLKKKLFYANLRITLHSFFRKKSGRLKSCYSVGFQSNRAVNTTCKIPKYFISIFFK